MYKVLAPNSWRFDDPIAQMVKVSSRGLRGHDLNSFIKRAGHRFVDDLAMVKAGEIPVHLIAIGAREYYNANRNGDGFSEAVCERTHPTFTKYARFYRNHKNKDPKISYGRVIKSAYHQSMRRIELLVGLNGDDRAVAANGGFLADKEMEKLAKGEDIPVSMACRVPYDVCSGCDNHARSQAEYCDGAMCKYGGLKHNIGRTFADGHTLYADNTEPTFFDISNVYRPADRIAYTFGRLEKAAAAGQIVSGAALAEELGLEIPIAMRIDPSTPERVARQIKIAHHMAEAEVQAARRQAQPGDAAFHPAVAPPIQTFPAVTESRSRLGETLHALAAEKVALSLRDFLVLVSGDVKQAEAALPDVAQQLPGVFGRLVASPTLDTDLRENPFNPSRATPATALRQWAQKQAAAHSLDAAHRARRATLAAIRSVPAPAVRTTTAAMEKEAADHGGAEQLARQFAIYELAFLDAVSGPEDAGFPNTAACLSRKNYLS